MIHFFGGNGEKKLDLNTFYTFLRGLHTEIDRLEFNHYDPDNKVRCSSTLDPSWTRLRPTSATLDPPWTHLRPTSATHDPPWTHPKLLNLPAED